MLGKCQVGNWNSCSSQLHNLPGNVLHPPRKREEVQDVVRGAESRSGRIDFVRLPRCVFAAVLLACSGLAVAQSPRPDSKGDSGDIASLVKQLGDPDPALRDAASAALVKLGTQAESQLEIASRSDDAEIRLRAANVLAKIRLRTAGSI